LHERRVGSDHRVLGPHEPQPEQEIRARRALDDGPGDGIGWPRRRMVGRMGGRYDRHQRCAGPDGGLRTARLRARRLTPQSRERGRSPARPGDPRRRRTGSPTTDLPGIQSRDNRSAMARLPSTRHQPRCRKCEPLVEPAACAMDHQAWWPIARARISHRTETALDTMPPVATRERARASSVEQARHVNPPSAATAAAARPETRNLRQPVSIATARCRSCTSTAAAFRWQSPALGQAQDVRRQAGRG
jgi:hypothetical protein